MSSLSFEVVTGGKTVKARNSKYAMNVFKKQIGEQVSSFFLKGTKTLGENAITSLLYVLAVFIQRLASRTPMDENYTYKQDTFQYAKFWGRSTKGKNKWHRVVKSITYHHHKDKNFARYDWEITCGGTKITTKDIADSLGEDVFYVENNAGSIKEIYSFFKTVFADKTIQQLSHVKIENDNNHIDVLEYGMYKNDSKVIKQGKWEHGVKNHYSVQAPRGMLRQTLIELRSIVDTQGNLKTGIAQRYRKQTSSKTLTDARLKRLLSNTDFDNLQTDINRSIDEVFKNLKVSDI